MPLRLKLARLCRRIHRRSLSRLSRLVVLWEFVYGVVTLISRRLHVSLVDKMPALYVLGVRD